MRFNLNYSALILVAGIGVCNSPAPTHAAAPTTAPTTAPTAAPNIKPDEFERMAKLPDHVILDVRTPEEYAAGHLPGAVNINWKAKDFNEQVAALDKGKTYLVHCAIGGRSRAACERLSKMDFPKLYNLEGGIMAWQRLGKPVEKSEAK